MYKKIWRREIVLKHISFTHEDPSVFVKSQWQRTNGISLFYFILRWSILIFFLTTWLISIIQAEVNTNSNARWLIYLTNWGYTICTTQSLLSVIMITSALLTERRIRRSNCAKEDYVIGKLYKIYWAINEIATVVAFAITILFWSLIYEGGADVGAVNLLVHGFNSIMMFLDLCIVAHPIRLFHWYWTISFGICYCVFSVVYYLAGGTDRLGSTAIYSILDWSKPRGTSLVCIGTLIFLILLHYFAYGVYRSRICLARRLIGDKEPSQSKTGIPNGGFVLEGVGALKVDERPNQTQTGITNVAFVPESA